MKRRIKQMAKKGRGVLGKTKDMKLSDLKVPKQGLLDPSLRKGVGQFNLTGLKKKVYGK